MQGLLSPQGSSGAVAPNSCPVSLDREKMAVSQILRAWRGRHDPDVVRYHEVASGIERPGKIGDPSWENLIDQLLQDLQKPSTRLDDLSFVPPSSKNRAFLPIFGRGVPLTCPTGCQNVEATVFFFEELKAYGESDLVEASGGSFIC